MSDVNTNYKGRAKNTMQVDWSRPGAVEPVYNNKLKESLNWLSPGVVKEVNKKVELVEYELYPAHDSLSKGLPPMGTYKNSDPIPTPVVKE